MMMRFFVVVVVAVDDCYCFHYYVNVRTNTCSS
jgi:hypothetical protein